MNWFHEPLITPELGFYCLIGLVLAGYLAQVVIWIMWPRKVEDAPEPLSDAPGDWPNLGGM